MIQLPKNYVEKMKGLLKEEAVAFLNSYKDTKSVGLRVNTLKVSVREFLNIHPFTLTKVPWTETGFYYEERDKPGKHPYHDAGLYYIQEPSAMAVAEFLNPQPGEKILDLCAAPGGKTTHIAEKMKQQGLIVANELYPSRAKVLSQNIERMGIKNAIVMNETSERLAHRFGNYFDKVLVDAPCSGEGMFRKNPDACEEWSLDHVSMCAIRQLDILEQASRMLRVGGRLVYSTCTFSPEENESVISEFLKSNPNFEIVNVPVFKHFSSGRKDWADTLAITNIEKTIRIWPHHVKGEGHYIAVLTKTDGEEAIKRKKVDFLKQSKQLDLYFKFASEYLKSTPKGDYFLFGDQLYIIPEDMLSFKGLKVIRPGWHLGTMKKNRFEPSHALALSLNVEEVAQKYSFNVSEIVPYLKGESLYADGAKGWYLIEVDGYSIGWGKLTDHVLKNHYPKGLRWPLNV
ncbi:RsmF rRNA methyltransferase first C-terminal domain-containing protein [Pueribacillus sp. YX66]|uniref:RsmF rRNA methyltransferase first C-terminal domain-containing protein n=1 Tax=Pueribacillus sp. YX66 TaxID=3229242 RepID=UPI00358D52F5